jgi:mono/diheme cytochrome c family protein
MKRVTLFLACLTMLFVLAGNSQEKKPAVQEPKDASQEWKIPPEEAARANPVKPTEASIAEGKKLYGYQCSMCHGEDGSGKTELAETMKLTMKDYRDASALKDFSDGALFYVLEKGKGKMPGQEGRMKADQKWNLVNYIRTLAKKEAAKPKEEKPSN